MPLKTTVPARNRNLTTVGAVKREFGNTLAGSPFIGPENDAMLAQLIAQASDAIVQYCNRPFARETYLETLPGFESLELMLARTPLIAVPSVTLYSTTVNPAAGAPITDYIIADPGVGTLYRDLGWQWTAQVGWVLTSYILPRSEMPSFAVAYVAGFWVPDDDVVIANDISVLAADQSFNSASGRFPPLQPPFAVTAGGTAGESFTTSGFSNAGNNGTFVVVSASPTKLTVAPGSGLVNEAIDQNQIVTVSVRTLPADIEKACLEVVRGWYFARQRDPNLTSKHVGDFNLVWGRGTAAGAAEIPFSALALLSSYKRFF